MTDLIPTKPLKRLRVLITSPSLNESENVSGVASVVRNILLGLHLCENPISIRTHLIGRKDSDKNLLLWLLKQISVPLLFVSSLLTYKPQVVHMNGPLDKLAVIRDLILIKIAQTYGCSILLHLHGGPFVHTKPNSQLLDKAIRHMLSISNVIVVLGEVESENIQQLYGANKNKIYVIPNAVPVSNTMPERKTRNSKTLNILFMGRFVEEKGIQILIEALLDLKKTNVDFKACFYGAGPLQEHIIESLSTALGDAFLFGGIAKGPEKFQIFSHTDILVLPSLQGEGLPMVILEAMASGIVIVATPDGSIPEVIHDKHNGFLVPKGDSQTLASLLQTLANMKSAGLLYDIEQRAFDSVLKKYDVIPYTRKLLDLYKKIA